MTDSLAAVARGIGMEVWPPEMPGASWWVDDEAAICYVDDPECDSHLRTYLLTGDRPLRILDAYDISVQPTRPETGQMKWLAGRGKIRRDYPTPAEAILACAEGIK